MVLMKKSKNKIHFVTFMITFIVIINACSEISGEKEKDVILVKMGENTISVNEFIRRAEYTIRPKYCNKDNNLHKKIVLNSLIAELMLANEIDKNNELEKNEQFQAYIRGRKEQAMREWLQHEEGTKKISVEDSEIQKIYDIASRTYHVKYFDIPNDSISNSIKEKLEKNEVSFEFLQNQVWAGKKDSEKEINWNPKENPVINDALYTKKLKQNSIIGPLKIGEDDYILLKVKDWVDESPISNKDQKQLWNDIKDDITRKRASAKYNEFILSVMKGKKLDFNKATFDKIVKLLAPIYVRSKKEKKKLLSDVMFDQTIKNPELIGLKTGMKGIYNNSFIKIDNKIWTVEEFLEELDSHPLVFRNKVKKETQFPQQFRLAVADLIRDKYLTKVAYDRGYQNNYSVKEYVSMWRNSLLAQYKKEEYLKKSIPNLSDSLSTYRVIKNYLNPYIDSLQEKYSNHIEINVKEFNKIKLSRIDLFTFEQNVPYPIMVPNFPQITTDYNLNYGKRMN